LKIIATLVLSANGQLARNDSESSSAWSEFKGIRLEKDAEVNVLEILIPREHNAE